MDVRTVKRLAASRCEPDHSETNTSSIGFLFEFDSARILFIGDGDVPPRPLAEHEGGRVHIDTLKVPHHGSDHNIPRELLQLIDCRHYLISTSGARHSARSATPGTEREAVHSRKAHDHKLIREWRDGRCRPNRRRFSGSTGLGVRRIVGVPTAGGVAYVIDDRRANAHGFLHRRSRRGVGVRPGRRDLPCLL